MQRVTTIRTTFSLMRRLLGLVLACILIAATLLGVNAYRSALRDADALFDLHLQQMAHSLRGVPLGVNESEPLPPGPYDVFVQIWRPDGTQLFRSSRLALPPSAVLGFSDADVDGTRLRVYTLQTPLHVVQIAQDMDARLARARAMALRATLPMALIAPLLMLAVGWIITRSLAPVERVRGEVARRAEDDLSPLPDDGLPREVQPLVKELNLLFGRVSTAFEAQKSFVADAAHELRSPLTALKLQIEGLRRAGDEATRAQAVARLSTGVERAIHLVNQLLALARQEAGGDEARQQAAAPVDLEALIGQCVSAALPHAGARRIDLGVAQVEAASVPGDAGALRILLANLIDNAIKYAPEAGRVDVSLVRGDGGLPALVVEDDGPGIPEAERERVFDRFSRLPGSGAEGSGLGLAIVRSIAQRHGAQVLLQRSERLGGLRAVVRFAPPTARA